MNVEGNFHFFFRRGNIHRLMCKIDDPLPSQAEELELPKSLVPDLVEAFSNSWRQTEEFPKPRRSLSAFVSAARLGGSQIKENRERADRRERRERKVENGKF